jgi:hydrogenase nickel incorporation protein HypA/HybF
MHELAIATNIVKIVQDEVAARHLKGAVEKVLFRAGKLNAIVPEILRFDFDVLKKEVEILTGTTLEIEEVPIRVKCKSCSKENTIEEPFFLCLDCGSPVTVETGQEMFVERITFKEEEK